MLYHLLYKCFPAFANDENYGIPPFGYSLSNCSFRVVIRPNGTLFAVEDIRKHEDKRFKTRQIPTPKCEGRTNNVCPRFLCDRIDYILGFYPNDKNPERRKQCALSFREEHLKLEEEIGSRDYSAICRFLENLENTGSNQIIEEYPFLKDLKGGMGVFRILGESEDVHENPEVRQWWVRKGNQYWEHEIFKHSKKYGKCFVTEKTGQIVRGYSIIKGIGGTNPKLTSSNQECFESYGEKGSANTPISYKAEFCCSTLLNTFTNGPMKDNHTIRLGDTTIVFWTDAPDNKVNIFKAFGELGKETQDIYVRDTIKHCLTSIRKGQKPSNSLSQKDNQTPFYIAGFRANSPGRISLMFFNISTFGKVLDNIGKHYQDIGSKNPPNKQEFPSNFSLLKQTLKEGEKFSKVMPGLQESLFNSIVNNTLYPYVFINKVLNRIKADRKTNYYRTCILTGYLRRNCGKEINMSLNTEEKNLAYNCGRMAAAVVKTERDVLERPNVPSETLARTFAVAPGNTYPLMRRKFQYQVRKLNPGLKVNGEKLMQEIAKNFPPNHSFPQMFSLENQILFWTGYDHQMGNLYTKKDKGSV